MKNAHAPYSKFPCWSGHPARERQNLLRLQCGERFLRHDELRRAHGDLFGGGATWVPKLKFEPVAVMNDHGVPCSPCGACRQVIYEFGPDAMIFFQGANGPKQAHITELLPEGFRLQ